MTDGVLEAAATVLIDVSFTADPTAWEFGPLVLQYETPSGGVVRTTAEARGTYFHPRTAATLYGTPSQPTRWHRTTEVDQMLSGQPVLAVELIRAPTFVAPGRGYLVVHVDLGDDPLGALSGLRRVSSEAVATLSGGGVFLTLGSQRSATVSYVSFGQALPSGPYGDDYRDWSDAEQWLRTLASATPPGEFEPDPEMDRQSMLGLSRSWRAMVLRDGVAFLALRPAVADEFLNSPQPSTYVRTVYTDTVLLGLMQKLSLHDIAERMSDRSDGAGATAHLREIEVRLDTFRTTLWFQNVTQHGTANEILTFFQTQHGLPRLLEQVINDLGDSARLHGLIDGERTADSLNAITAVGLPAGAVLATAPIWVEYGVVTAAVTLAVAGILAAIAIFGLKRLQRKRSR